jgi:uncharacterized protein YkwD
MLVVLRHGASYALIGLLLLATLATADLHAQRTTSGTQSFLPMIVGASLEEQVVALVNQQRRLNGCNIDLKLVSQLASAAYGHSQDMALNNLFSHTGSDNSTMQERVDATHYQYSQLAENIAVGYATPQAVVDAWMHSAGHRANILNCTLHEIGVGYYYQSDDQANVRDDAGSMSGPYYYYWTQDFGTPMP